jgi:hypothetical protein
MIDVRSGKGESIEAPTCHREGKTSRHAKQCPNALPFLFERRAHVYSIHTLGEQI